MERIENCDIDLIHEENVKKVLSVMPKSNKLESLADLYKVFGEPNRVKILYALSVNELCVWFRVVVNMTQSEFPSLDLRLQIVRMS